MTLRRSDIADHLNIQFSALASSIGQATMPEHGYSSDIDAALRKLGVARDDLPTATLDDSQDELAFALGEYYAAQRIWRQLGKRVDHTMGQTTIKFDGQRKQAKEIMEQAANQCASLGCIVDGRTTNKPFIRVY